MELVNTFGTTNIQVLCYVRKKTPNFPGNNIIIIDKYVYNQRCNFDIKQRSFQ